MHQARLHHVLRRQALHHSCHASSWGWWILVHVLHSRWWRIDATCWWWILGHRHTTWWWVLCHGLIHLLLRSSSCHTRYWRTWWRIRLRRSRNSLPLTISIISTNSTQLFLPVFFSHFHLISEIRIRVIICTIWPNNNTSRFTLIWVEII